jgi:rhodanese-related sulfurtransferase
MMGLWPFSRGATVSVRQASSTLAAGDAVLLDVRERFEFDSAHPREARHRPLSRLDAASLSPDTRYLVICHSGARAAIAARSLRRAGLDATNVRGGMIAWQRAALPVDFGPGRGRRRRRH